MAAASDTLPSCKSRKSLKSAWLASSLSKLQPCAARAFRAALQFSAFAFCLPRRTGSFGRLPVAVVRALWPQGCSPAGAALRRLLRSHLGALGRPLAVERSVLAGSPKSTWPGPLWQGCKSRAGLAGGGRSRSWRFGGPGLQNPT